MNHRKACLTAALLTAIMIVAVPAVCAEDSPQPEVSIIDITMSTGITWQTGIRGRSPP